MKNAALAVSFLTLVCAAASVPAFAGTVYNSGASNFNEDAWAINDGFSVSNEFTLTQSATISGATFGYWAFPGDTITAVDWSFGSAAYGTDNGSGTASTTVALAGTEQYGYDYGTVSFDIPTLTLGPGTYYFTLQNGVVPSGDPIYWDENDGSSIGYSSADGPIGVFDCNPGYVGCDSSGGETFTLTNTSTPPVPEPSSLLLLGTGLAGFATMVRRKLRG
jgi:hypothetical protein